MGVVVPTPIYKILFRKVPQVTPDTAKIPGVICEHHVEGIKKPLMQKLR